MWGVGIIPLFVSLVFGVILIVPYVSVIAIVTSVVLLRHVKRLDQRGEVNDRGY
jgi:hypothetical protein